MIPASLMSHLFHLVHSGKQRAATPHHPHHFPSKRIDYTPTAFLLLLVSGRAMCYLTKNNNEGDGKCNLIPLIQLPLSPPVTGKQEAITVQHWHRFQTRGRREIAAAWLSGTHLDSSLPRLASPPLINNIVSL